MMEGGVLICCTVPQQVNGREWRSPVFHFPSGVLNGKRETELKRQYPSAVGADPRDIIAGHSPQVFIHAGLADQESAGTVPVKAAAFTAAGTILLQPSIRFFRFPSARAHRNLPTRVKISNGSLSKRRTKHSFLFLPPRVQNDVELPDRGFSRSRVPRRGISIRLPDLNPLVVCI